LTSDKIGSHPLRVVFFGTPSYAVPALEALATDPRYTVSLVVTQPDRPAGRGRELQASPVKACALDLGLTIYQPESLRTPEARAPLEAADADLFVVAAYGLIFGQKTLALPRVGCVNLHASLLPAYRGASPVTAALLAGDEVTGVTLMVMEQGLDTGPIISTIEVGIDPTDTTGSLTEKLAAAAAELVRRDLPRFASGALVPQPQPPGATMVRPLIKADGWIVWEEAADAIERRVRAMQPWPRAWTTLPSGLQLQLLEARAVRRHAEPQRLEIDGQRLFAGCGSGAIELVTVQPAGSRAMTGWALAQGRRVAPGDRLGETGAPPPPPPYLTRVDDTRD
jgi:methionyl-tRNA formyltransferase